jgi:hypothetical protein
MPKTQLIAAAKPAVRDLHMLSISAQPCRRYRVRLDTYLSLLDAVSPIYAHPTAPSEVEPTFQMQANRI